MTHARTLPRYVGIAGLVAGLLAPVPSLAVAPGATAEILTVGASGQSTTSAIGARVNAAYRHAAGTARYYKNLSLMIPRAQLRTGALAVLNAGRVLPGLGLAAMAAGFVIAEGDIFKPGVNNPDNIDVSAFPTDPESYGSSWAAYNDYQTGYYNNPATACLTADLSHLSPPRWVRAVSQETPGVYRCSMASEQYAGHGSFLVQRVSVPADSSIDDAVVPVDETDLEEIDGHLPDEIVDEIADEAPEVIPAWTEEISVVPDAAAIVSDVAAAPAVYEGVSEWANAMSDAMEGTSSDAVDGKTAAEATYEQSLADREQAIPAFGEVAPEWQVETIDSLPSYSIGLGGGSCPAPTQIDIPLYGSVTLDWQPACDLAGMLRGAVIGVCMILSLYIVLRGS